MNLESLFDASASTPGKTSVSIVSYAWSFGDGDTANGVRVHHSYDTTGNFTLTLTVINDRGVTATKSQTLSVGASAPPSADFTVSPTDNPVPNQTINFNAVSSTAQAGRHIVSYTWDFGDGSPAVSGVQTSHSWTAAGTYTVTLTVLDDADQKGTKKEEITVGDGKPKATFSVSPVANSYTRSPNITLNFDASASKAATGSTIKTYEWDFGDGTKLAPNASPTASKNTSDYPDLGGTEVQYPITVTVTDDQGRKDSFTVLIKVK
jgi:PKD repeat protein